MRLWSQLLVFDLVFGLDLARFSLGMKLTSRYISMSLKLLKDTILIVLTLQLLSGCGETSESFTDHSQATETDPIPDAVAEPTPTPSRTLLVSSGACYAGGVTTSGGSNLIAAFDATTGEFKRVLVDYNTFSPGDSPMGIVDFSADKILVLVENTGGRRIDIVNKDGTGLSTYLTNGTALNAIVRRIDKHTDNSLVIAKVTAIEKFNYGKGRYTQGATTPFINTPGSSCGTAASAMTGLAVMPNGKIIYTHAATSPNNKIAIISAQGYITTADCLASQAAPATTALPTAALLHSSGKLLVSYGSTTAPSNSIYSYTINPTTNAFSNATASINNPGIINGPSAMTEDTTTGHVFVANGNTTFNNVEKFALDSTTQALTRVSDGSFLPSQIYTRCVTDLKVID